MLLQAAGNRREQPGQGKAALSCPLARLPACSARLDTSTPAFGSRDHRILLPSSPFLCGSPFASLHCPALYCPVLPCLQITENQGMKMLLNQARVIDELEATMPAWWVVEIDEVQQ